MNDSMQKGSRLTTLISEKLGHFQLNAIGIRGVSRTAETSKMERFVIIVNRFQLLTIIKKRSILDVAAVLDRPLGIITTDITTFYLQTKLPEFHRDFLRFLCFDDAFE